MMAKREVLLNRKHRGWVNYNTSNVWQIKVHRLGEIMQIWTALSGN